MKMYTRNMEGHLINFLPKLEDTMPITETVAPRKVYYRLGESEIFTTANKTNKINGEVMVDVIPKMVVNNQGFTHHTLEDFDKVPMYELFVSNRYRLSCKNEMKRMLNNNEVTMVYTEKYNLPVSIPYIIQGDGTRTRVFVNVSDYMDLNAYGKLEVPVARNFNALMSALLGACLAYSMHSNLKGLPASMADGVVLTYSDMLTKCITSLTHVDSLGKEQVRYLCTQFAMVQMYGTDEGLKLFYRMKAKYFPNMAGPIMDLIDSKFVTDNFDTISRFISSIESVIPSAKGLALHTVLDRWIRSYGAACAFGLDYMGYHLYTIVSTLMESPLIARTQIEPILARNGGEAIYKGIQQLIGEN